MSKEYFRKLQNYWIKRRMEIRRLNNLQRGRPRQFFAFPDFGKPWLIDNTEKRKKILSSLQ